MSDELKQQTKIDRFEKLIAWQKARDLTQVIYTMTRSHEKFSRNFSLVDQMQRAAVSIMSNIAEGYERKSKAEFHRYLLLAKGSCAELRSQLYVALDVGYISKEEFSAVIAQAEETGRVIGGLRVAVSKLINAAAG